MTGEPTDRATVGDGARRSPADPALLPILATAGRAPRRNNDVYVVGVDGAVERRIRAQRVHRRFERRALELGPAGDVAS